MATPRIDVQARKALKDLKISYSVSMANGTLSTGILGQEGASCYAVASFGWNLVF